MLGKVAITMCFGVVYIYSTELFPTPVRSIAVGTSSMMARLSGLIAPFMGQYMVRGTDGGGGSTGLHDRDVPHPSEVVGTSSMIASVSSHIVPLMGQYMVGVRWGMCLHPGEASVMARVIQCSIQYNTILFAYQRFQLNHP